MTVVAPPDPAEASAAPEAPPRPPVPPLLRVCLAVSLSFTALMAFLALFGVGLSALQEERSQHQLYAKLRGLLAPASTVAPPLGGEITGGAPLALLSAPKAGISRAVVVEGTSSGDLLAGPGHLRDSALPGQVGQSVLVGKSVTAGAPFRHVPQLAAGDDITVTTGQGTFHFSVIDRRGSQDRPPEIPSGGSVLTLVTSTGSGWLGALAPGHLVYVDAKLDGKAVIPPPGRPVSVPTAELPGNDDPSVWPFIVLWLQALLVTGVGVVWSWARWGRRQTWLVGAPLVLAVAWGVADTAMRLLPNVV